VGITFYPPSRKIDRGNMPHLVKAYLDGLADALRVNDRRFLPSYHFAESVKNPCVVITLNEFVAPSESGSTPGGAAIL
jgi:hypothetical protein